MTLHELGHRMSVQEFALWQAWDRDCAIGDERADTRAAVVASTVANYAGRALAEGETKSVADFMLRRRSDPAPASAPAPESDADPLDFFRGL